MGIISFLIFIVFSHVTGAETCSVILYFSSSFSFIHMLILKSVLFSFRGHFSFDNLHVGYVLLSFFL